MAEGATRLTAPFVLRSVGRHRCGSTRSGDAPERIGGMLKVEIYDASSKSRALVK
jgi:hypothetical protein